MIKLVLTQDEYEQIIGAIFIVMKAADSELMKKEINELYQRIQAIAADCNDEFRAGQVDIINKFKDILEIE